MIISFRFLFLISFKWSTKYYVELLGNEIIKSLFEKSKKFVYPKIQNQSRKKDFGFLDKEVFSEFDWLIFFLYPKLYPNLYPNLYQNLVPTVTPLAYFLPVRIPKIGVCTSSIQGFY